MQRDLRRANRSARAGPTGILAALLLVGAGAPASGNVCNVGVAGGSLHVACDEDTNDVVIEGLGVGLFQISSGDSTLFDEGAGPGPGPVLRAGITRNVNVSLGDGEDLLEVASVLIQRNLVVTSGDGRNELLLADSEVAGDVVVENGNGGSETDCESSVIGGNLKYTNGQGDDEAKIDECEVLGNVQISNDGGSSVLDIESETVIEGDVQLTNGDGEVHEVGVEESSILGSVRIHNGSAEEIVVEMEAEEGTTILIGGDINVENGAADLHVFELEGAEGEANFSVGGSIRVSNGPGGSEVTLEKDVLVMGDVHHTSGSGFDSILFELGIEVQGSVRIEQGDGGSETFLDGSGIGGDLMLTADRGGDLVDLADVVVGGKTSLKVGADDDEVTVADSTFVDAFTAEGGGGTDCFEEGGNDFQGRFRVSSFEFCAP